MPTANPMHRITEVTSESTCNRWLSSSVWPIAAATAVKPKSSGTPAATNAPKASTRMISVIGTEVASAMWKSQVAGWRLRAPLPVTCLRAPYCVRAMMGRSHVLVAGAGYLTIAAMAPGALGHLPPAQLAAGAVCAGAASLLPDLDCPGSTIARALGPLSDLLARLVSLIAGGHRNGTHSLLAWLAVSVGFTLALGARHGSTVALSVCVLACALMLRVITGAGAIGCGMLAFGAGVALVTGVGRVDRCDARARSDG